jgi:hypothetical protein
VTESEAEGAPAPGASYEQFAGAALRPLAGKWRRREPENTLLHATVRAHLRTFLEEARGRTAEGAGLPRFVGAEFERYLACGILAHGFARVRCRDCGDELLVGLSCKGRGFCPSCTTRRMHDTAARLVDGVLPHVPVRQWVLSLPRWARWLLARDPSLVSSTLEVTLRTIFANLRKRARRAGVRGSRAGAITFVQRFGGSLNLNVHLHCVIPDGVFVREKGAIRFVPLGAPPDSEVEAILRRIVVRLLPLLHARREAMETEQPDALASAQTETLLLPAAPKESLRRGRHSAFLEGFSLHAGVHLHANDREGLEKLCGYGARPPLSLKRLSALPDGRLAYRLKRPLGDGREVLALRPTELLRRLATLVPPPRHHLVRYHGVFGPNSAWRAEIVPRPPESGAAACHPAPVQPPPGESPASTAAERPSSGRQTRIPWSELLQRVFREDVLQCPCGGRRVVLAFLTDATVVKAMLEHLGLPATGPPIAPARPHEQPDFTTWQDDVPELQQALR